MHTFSTRRRIEFADTDLGGIAHFSRFFIFMETAEHEFLEALGTNVVSEWEGKRISWPRVSAACDYRSPARFGDVLDIELRVERKGVKSMTYGFRFRCDGREIATGRVTSVCCLNEPGEVQAIPIPDFIRDKIDEAPR